MASEKNGIENRERVSELADGGHAAGGDRNYTFMKEKIVPRKKKKLKRFLLTFCSTVFLAVVFGIVAQTAFVYSEPWVEKFLGKEKDTPKQPVVLPTGEPTPSGTTIGTDDRTDANRIDSFGTTGEQDATGNQGTTIGEGKQETTHGQEDDPEEPTGGGTEQSVENPTEPAKPTPIIVQQRIEADIMDFIEIYSDIKSLAAEANSFVLNITAVTNGFDWFNDPYEEKKTATGLVLADNGTELLLLTTLDRIEGADTIEVEISSYLSVQGYVLDYERDVNLAIVAVPIEQIPSEQLNTIKKATFGEFYTLSPGTPIVAVGSPNGHVGSIEIGLVTSQGSSVYIVDNRVDLFNTNLTDNEVSDGVIINMRGQVVGLITHTLKEGLNENLSTAIGLSRIMPLIQRLANQEERVYFGIRGEEIPKDILEKVGIEQGIYVNTVDAKSPALEAGIKSGDMIVEVMGTPINTMIGFYNEISKYSPKEIIEVTVYRQSQGIFKKITESVVLAKKTG